MSFGGGDAFPTQLTLDANYSSDHNYTDTLRSDGAQAAFTRIDASANFAGRDAR